jgi:hypothetical protein
MNATRQTLANVRLVVCLGLSMALGGARALEAQDAPAESQQIQVLPLKHTSAAEVLQVIRQVTQGPGVEVAADTQSNALIIKAAAGTLEEIKRIVAELDIEQGMARQVKIFQLQHLVPGPTLENTLAAVAEGEVRFAMDVAHNAVVASGTEQSLAVVEALLTRLDTQTSQPAARELQLRLVWLVGGLADDAAAAPPPDLESIAQELAKIGVTNLTMAAQIVINVTEGEKFSASGSAKVNEPCTVEFAGVLGELRPEGARPAAGSDRTPLRLEISALAPAGEHARPLCQLQTTIKVPLGQSVVLGVTPVESKPAVFVVQALPQLVAPAAVKKD